MANYSDLIQTINDSIKSNGNQEITGPVLNEVLQAMVSSLGEGYQFMGVATPNTNPGTPDEKVFYIATEPGMYANFGNLDINKGITTIYFNGSNWLSNNVLSIVQELGNSKGAVVSQKTVTDNLAKLDQKCGSIELIDYDRGSQYLKNFTSKREARESIDVPLRKRGLNIKYLLNNVLRDETFGDYSLDSSGEGWFIDSRWTDNTNQYAINGSIRLNSEESPASLLTFNSRNEARDSVISKYRLLGCTISYFLQIDDNHKKLITETYTGTTNNNWLKDNLWIEKQDILFTNEAIKTDMHIDNYIKGVLSSCKNILSIASVAYSGNNLTIYIAEFTLDGVFIKYVARLVAYDVNSLAKGNNVIVTLEQYDPDDPIVKVVLDVDRLLLSGSFAYGNATVTPDLNQTRTSYIRGDITNTDSLKLNYGAYYPFVNVPDTWRQHYYAQKAFGLFKAILDIKIIGANPDDEYVYTIIYLFKERVANDWGNGIRIGKIKRDDPTIVEYVDYKSTEASSDVATELNKIALNKPVWMHLSAFGCTFEILIDGSDLGADTDGFGEFANNASAPFWGYYISESTYVKSVAGGISRYKTVTDAAMAEVTGVINVGQSIIIGQKRVSLSAYDNFNPLLVHDNYINIYGNKIFKKVKRSELKRIQVDGVDMYVSSFSDKYVYYTAVKSLSPVNSMESDSYQYSFFAFADKNTPDKVIKINLPEQLPESEFPGKPGRRHHIIELPDGNHLIDVENGIAADANVRYHKLYKVYGIFTQPVSDNALSISDENIKFLFKLTGKLTRLVPAWGVHNYGKNTLISPYGSGRVGLLYLSKDSFETWKCIFNMGVDDVYVEPKGATGYWPTEESVIPSGSLIWANTGNGNAHIHGSAYDPWYNRYWVVTGDGSGLEKSVTGIWYTDDEGENWHKVEISEAMYPFSRHGTQMITIMPMEQCVLFATDGTGDGFYRWNRTGKDEAVTIELVYNFTGANTVLEVLGGGHCFTNSGFVLSLFNPDNEHQGDFERHRGGVVSSYNGYFFEKIYEDEFSEGTADTAEINWMGVIGENSDGDVLIKAENGGYIRLIVE